MMRGLAEAVFLGQWGPPEIRINLIDFSSSFILDFIPAKIDDFVLAWIYEKKDMVLFFKEQRLISHFKWSQFKKRFQRANPGSSDQQNMQ